MIKEGVKVAEVKPLDYLWLLDDRTEKEKTEFVRSLSPLRRTYYERMKTSGFADMVVAVEEMDTFEREKLYAWASEAISRDPNHRGTPGLRQIKQAIEEWHALVDDNPHRREPGD